MRGGITEKEMKGYEDEEEFQNRKEEKEKRG